MELPLARISMIRSGAPRQPRSSSFALSQMMEVGLDHGVNFIVQLSQGVFDQAHIKRRCVNLAMGPNCHFVQKKTEQIGNDFLVPPIGGGRHFGQLAPDQFHALIQPPEQIIGVGINRIQIQLG